MGYIKELKKFHNQMLSESGGRQRDLIPITEDDSVVPYTHSLRAQDIINFTITELLPIAYSAEGKKRMAAYLSSTPFVDIEDRDSTPQVLLYLQSAGDELMEEARAVNKITEKMNDLGYVEVQRTLRKLLNAVETHTKARSPEYDLAIELADPPEYCHELMVQDKRHFLGDRLTLSQVSATGALTQVIKCLIFKKDRLQALAKLREFIPQLEATSRENAIIKAILTKLGAFGFYITVPPGTDIYEEYMSTIDLCLSLLTDLAADLPPGKPERIYDTVEVIERKKGDWARLHDHNRDDLAEGYDSAIKSALVDAFELVVALSRRPDETIDRILDSLGV